MPLRQRLKSICLSLAGEAAVREVRIGLAYTGVQLEDGRVGVAFTFEGEFRRGHPTFSGLRPLAGKRASQLLGLFDSTDRIEAAVALATANALANVPRNGMVQRDALQALAISSKDRVAMIGHFAPLVPRLKERTAELRVFEEIEDPQSGLLPVSEAPGYLDRCDIAIITSSAILTDALDGLLQAARCSREVVLMGASTPLLSEAFEDTPVTCLGGVLVQSPGETMRVISEGGGTRLLRNCITKVTVRRDP